MELRHLRCQVTLVDGPPLRATRGERIHASRWATVGMGMTSRRARWSRGVMGLDAQMIVGEPCLPAHLLGSLRGISDTWCIDMPNKRRPDRRRRPSFQGDRERMRFWPSAVNPFTVGCEPAS
jgi:hypothetical protein